MAIDKPAQRGLARRVDPAVDAVRDDVVEGRQVEPGRRGEIDEVEAQIGDPGFGREAAGMVDMRRHQVDAVEGALRMGGGEDVCRHPLAAAEVAPGEAIAAVGRLDPAYECDMIEPRRRQHRLEVAQVGDVGHIAAEIARHRPPSGFEISCGRNNATSAAPVDRPCRMNLQRRRPLSGCRRAAAICARISRCRCGR